jgi:hypothetical protein
MIISYGCFKSTTFFRNVEDVYPTPKRNTSKEFNLQQHRCENIKSRSEVLFAFLLHCEEFNPLNAELNPICHSLPLLGAHHILHISRVRVKQKRTTKQDTQRTYRIASCGFRVSIVSMETIVLFIVVGVDVTVSNIKCTLFP